MNSIPNISFKSTEGSTDIEFLSLAELFSRIEENPSHNPHLPHRISFFALLIVTEGKGVHQVDLKNYAVQKGSVLKIAKGQVHAFQNNFQYDGYLVVFTEDFVLRYFSTSSINFISHLYNYHISEPLVEHSPFNDFFLEKASEELQSKNSYAQKEIIAKILEIYLLKLERHAQQDLPEKGDKKHQAVFTQFKDLVEKNYTQTRNVIDYAAMLNISSKHLNLIVREITVNTAKHFIDQYVILEIKRNIFNSEISLKEVAFQTGFDEVTNFTKFFKRQTGLSPKEYKASL
ncbi:AraC-like DNA-binding protein [Algoriphagus ratkowskyi]|uniref:AraC-like DNA-binding protein n=1 Tax=Algoriphagus ratkowskyi TaxID=57028 RepID=A0A2W7RFS6_9BACT|nr:helix-turn-helix domain-containing protein [Algoriphagus ratkowskyi]PZX53109.1 AraC-like DNA-binding protein [Algoriphagus ratkowskyi]TXD76387.1 helix-turn-helix domain-containing protein [Algoriphagus ratkowskyi]